MDGGEQDEIQLGTAQILKLPLWTAAPWGVFLVGRSVGLGLGTGIGPPRDVVVALHPDVSSIFLTSGAQKLEESLRCWFRCLLVGRVASPS